MSKQPKVNNGRLCYAIQHQAGGEIIAFGVSIIAAWLSAEKCLGERVSVLLKEGYRLVEGKWRPAGKPVKPVITCPTCNGIGTIPKEAISVTRFGNWKSDSPRVTLRRSNTAATSQHPS